MDQKLLIFLLKLFVIISFLSNCSHSLTSYVKPIRSDSAQTILPSDANSILAGKVLLNANKYALGTWYQHKYASDHGKYLDFHGIHEHQIRSPAMEVFGLAVSLKTGLFNATWVEHSREQAINITKRLISSLAYRHKANTEHGWGDEWQSALWAQITGFSGWLLWDKLDEQDRLFVEKMVIHEADRFNNYKVPYYQDRNGNVIFKGDTKAEENAWNSKLLQLSTAMMPSHPNWKLWMRKNIELLVSSFACPHDLHNTTVINGKQVMQWLNGSNIFNNGSLVNHNRVHPDYMSTLPETISSPLTYTLANMETPLAAFWNDKLVYSALVNLHFQSPPFAKPGGTIYVRNATTHQPSADIYYPQGNDWGTKRKLNFADLDSQMSIFTKWGKEFHCEEWAYVHIDASYKMQQRFKDGRTYGGHEEDTYLSREEWISSLAGNNYLTRWMGKNFKLEITNKDYAHI